MSLTDYHAYYDDSIRWRLGTTGVEIEGSGVERSRGAPITVTRIWEAYADAINRTARAWRVPCALIIATIGTESAGKADAIRLEPGYVSDASTPGKISVGLMQTLISTAQDTMQMSFGRDWLLDPANSIAAGTAYMAQQAKQTGLDPPLVAAAYNAGKLVHQTGSQNRWKLLQAPIGTGAHCDRFVHFFNDAVYVLANHATRPAVGLEGLLGPAPSLPPARPTTPNVPAPAPVSRDTPVEITFASNALPDAVMPYSRQVLEDILRAAGLKSAVISSTARGPSEQARVMYNNLESQGVASQRKLYGRSGDRVIDVYEQSKAAGKTSTEIKADMETKIRELGPTNVSHHASDPHILNVFDVSPKSIKDHRAFELAVKADKRVSLFLIPPDDPGYHLEIPQPKSS